MKNYNLKGLIFALFVLVSLLSINVNALSLDARIPGIDDATPAAFSYLKSKFGDEYFNKNLLYLDTTRISKENAIGIPSITNQLISGASNSFENGSNLIYTNPTSNESLDYYFVRFKHNVKVDNKYYKVGFVEVYLDSNYQVARSFGVLNCAESKYLCSYRITEEQAYKITSENTQFKTSIKTAQLTYHANYNKIVWVVSLYPENENSFGKSIIIDSFNGDVLQKSDFMKSSYIYSNYNSTNTPENTVELKQPNALQRFFEWLGSFFR